MAVEYISGGKRIMFWIWHILAICTVMAVSFYIGHSLGKQGKQGKSKWPRL